MADLWEQNRTTVLAELRLGFALHRSRSFVTLDTDKLPAPLQPSAQALSDDDLTVDQRRAAAQEFLTLSEEWVDRG